MEFNSYLFKKHFKNKENAKVTYQKENGNQILLKMSLAVILKILRMKDEKIEIIWKSGLEKDIYKMGFEKIFSKSNKKKSNQKGDV